jgi:hypothetical protein
MSLAWQELNTALHIIGDAVSNVYGKGKRSGKLQHALDDLELSDE